MKENTFSKKMSSKSNQELEEIFEEKNKYTDEAILAVVLELQNRKLIDEEVANENIKNLSNNLKKESISKEVINENNSSFDEFELPVLYSKKSIQGFTIFFSTIFGVVLLMSNLKTMNKFKARTQVLVFGIVYTFFIYFMLNFLPKSFFVTLIFNLIGYGILSEYFWNKELGKELKFKKKNITKPLVISLIITMAVIFLMFLPMIIDDASFLN